MHLKERFIRLQSLMLMVVLALSSTLPSATTDSENVHAATVYSNISSWAVSEVHDAYDASLIPSLLIGSDLTQKATREELCEITVSLYEALAGTQATAAAVNPFTDTVNPQILKAYDLGITSGISADLFAPDDFATREQVATMFSRTLLLLYTDDTSAADGDVFFDAPIFSSWALAHIQYINRLGLIKGYNGNFMPRPSNAEEIAQGYGMIKREEALVIGLRAFLKFTDTEVPIVVNEDDQQGFELSLITEQPLIFENSTYGNLATILSDGTPYTENDLFRPTYEPYITLSALSGYDSSGSPTYSSTPYDSLISRNRSKQALFRIELSSRIRGQATSIRWQLSDIKFDGNPVGKISMLPPRLIANGSLSPTATTLSLNLADYNLPEHGTKVLYLRAYPVNSQGSIGDTGSGLPFYYGDPMVRKDGGHLLILGQNNPELVAELNYASTFSFNLIPSLKPSNKQGTFLISGENPYLFLDFNEFTHDANLDPIRHFLPEGYADNTEELLVQVSTAPYSGTTSDAWSNESAIVYEKSFFPDDQVFKDFTKVNTTGFALDFSQWAPSSAAIDNDILRYYIRYVTFVPKGSGFYDVTYSEMLQINYFNNDNDVTWYEPPAPVQIESDAAVITNVSYEKLTLEKQGWQYRYIVFKEPSALLKDLYDVGDHLDFTPQPENKNWLEEILDSVVDFFSDMVGYVSKIVNWASTAYTDLKVKLVDYAVKYVPLPNEAWRDKLRTAVEGMVDYGMMTIGLPPTLPNFDELTEMGADYLVEAALEEAGIPQSIVSESDREKIRNKLISQAKSSAATAHPNPMGWDFVKLDPDYLYSPARIIVTVENPWDADRASAPGLLRSNVDYQMTYDELNSPVYSDRYMSIIVGTSYFTLFKPFSVYVPSLEPGESMDIPIYFEPYVDEKMPTGNDHIMTYSDFLHLYKAYDFNFHLTLTHDLMPVNDRAKELGYPENGAYVYDSIGSSVMMTHGADSNWNHN